MRAMCLLLLLATTAAADEGMWTFEDFPRALLKQKYGFDADEKWLAHVRLSSGRLNNCSAGFVSAKGLLITNYHCARECVRDLSSTKADYLVDGFVTEDPKAEPRCPGLHLDRLEAISDVTDRVVAAGKDRSGAAFFAAQQAETGRIKDECQRDARTHCEVVTLYGGGLYRLYRYRRYDDVRLVFTPEEAIGAFGGDADNYEYPRWNLDMALLRAYEDGAPARTPEHFAWAKRGAAEGELVFFSGDPGQTNRLLTNAELQFQRDTVLPTLVRSYAEKRALLGLFRRRGEDEQRVAAPTYFTVTNELKRRRAQFDMVVKPAYITRHLDEEARLRDKVAADANLSARAHGAWDAIERAVTDLRAYYRRYFYAEQGVGFDSKLFQIARTLVRGADERALASDLRLAEFQDAALPQAEEALFSPAPIDERLEVVTLTQSLTDLLEELGPDDPIVKRVFRGDSAAELAARVVSGTSLKEVAARRALWQGGKRAVAASQDPMILLAAVVDPEARALRRRYENEYVAATQKNRELIAQARFAVYGRTLAPDGTFTPRLSFGVVRATVDRNGEPTKAWTTVAGLYARATGKPPFALPRRWLAARGKLPGDLPFNSVCTADATGGSSGSPVVNRKGELVGLDFDSNAAGAGSAFGYDESVRRGVFVHSELILVALEKVYGAARLAAELRGR